MKKKVTRLFVGAAVATGALALTVPQASATHLSEVKCSNGFSRVVPSRAAPGIVRALNAFNKYNQSGVTCALMPLPDES